VPHGVLEAVIPPEEFATHEERRSAEDTQLDGLLCLRPQPSLGFRTSSLLEKCSGIFSRASKAAGDCLGRRDIEVLLVVRALDSPNEPGNPRCL
jgi:hypothetical protein